MTIYDMKARTRDFALRVIRLVESLPKGRAADIIGRQLLRADTSVGANYRATQRAKSRADFINKLVIVEEEADECGYWLELLVSAGIIKPALLKELSKECDELTAIVVAMIKTAKRSRKSTA